MAASYYWINCILLNQNIMKNLTKVSNLFIACSFIIILVYASTVTKTKVDRLNKQLIKSSNYISNIKNSEIIKTQFNKS